MEEYAACDKCGLKAVRYELERRGIVLRFCDTCYWGEVTTDVHPAGEEVEGKRSAPASGEAPGGERAGGKGLRNQLVLQQRLLPRRKYSVPNRG